MGVGVLLLQSEDFFFSFPDVFARRGSAAQRRGAVVFAAAVVIVAYRRSASKVRILLLIVEIPRGFDGFRGIVGITGTVDWQRRFEKLTLKRLICRLR